MKSNDFQKILFQSAVSAMAVDGEIHNTEIEELKSIVKSTAYFLDFDFEKELEENVSNIKKNGKEAINQYLLLLSTSDLSAKQEIILMEIVLRMLEADQKFDSNEIKFLQMVKAKIKTSEEVLVMKFPKQIDYLMDFNNYGSTTSFDSDITIQ
ncbi:MAG: hypothetical protein WBO28_02390 [Flavobacteriales bacterium]